MPLPKLWYLEYISGRNAIYMKVSGKFGKDSSEKLNDSKERESYAEKSSPNSELGQVEVRVHEEAKLKVSHAHATSWLAARN